jgi:DNA-binding XRE family transcriptional regulator
MAFVDIAPLSDGTAFKVGKAIAPSSRLSQLLQYYDFDTSSILIVDCKLVENAYALEFILHKACSKMQKLMPYDGGTEFFSSNAYQDAIAIAESVCRINGYRTVPFIRQKNDDPIDEAGLIVASFSNKIRARRLELNLTQAQVAELAGVGKRTVERIENSGNTTFYNMVCVLRSLDLEYLFAELEITDPIRKRARPIDAWSGP